MTTGTSCGSSGKRVYAPPEAEDGLRVLVDCLWPRGLARERAQIGVWLKVIAPSHGLRRRYHGDPPVWGSSRPPITPNSNSRRRTRRSVTCSIASPVSEPLTLLFAARDETRKNTAALKEWARSAGPVSRRAG
jgi:uncharacterized protein YeaO (DUF488 family)